LKYEREEKSETFKIKKNTIKNSQTIARGKKKHTHTFTKKKKNAQKKLDTANEQQQQQQY
jgi:hypothetical protein